MSKEDLENMLKIANDKNLMQNLSKRSMKCGKFKRK